MRYAFVSVSGLPECLFADCKLQNDILMKIFAQDDIFYAYRPRVGLLSKSVSKINKKIFGQLLLIKPSSVKRISPKSR